MTEKHAIPHAFNAYYFAFYCTMAVRASFFSVFFFSIGMSASQLGLLFGVAPLLGFVAQPMFGYIGDTARYKNYALYLILGAAALLTVLMMLWTDHLYISMIYILFATVFNCAVPMQDAVTLDYVHIRGGTFNNIRVFGCIGYIIFCIVSGLIVGRLSGGILQVFLAALLITTGIALFLPKVPGYRKRGKKVHIWPIVRQGKILRVLLMVMTFYATLSVFSTFASPYILQIGGSSLMVGIGTAAAALSELPFYFRGGAGRLVRKFGIGRVLFLSAIVLSLRYLIIGLIRSPYAIILTNLMQGFPMAMMVVGVVEYINENVPPELKASGQMMLTMFSVVIARFIGNLGGGMLVQRVNDAGGNGVQALFLCMAPLIMVMVLICCTPLLKEKPGGQARRRNIS
ncbi:MAG: MFS transporter [Christensenellales bacterium]|jgi:PPP family 3-phenylpropionic acid transporter